MATVEITDKLVGMWFLALTGESDWLCGLTEIVPEREYQISYRFRYYKDDKVHDSDDRKSAYSANVHSSRAYALAALRMVADGLKQAGAIGEIDEVMMHDKDVKRFIRELQDKPWAFLRVEGRPKP